MMEPVPINSTRCPECGRRVTYNMKRAGARERQLNRHLLACPALDNCEGVK